MESVTYAPIGVVRSPYQQPRDVPPPTGEGRPWVAGRVDLEADYSPGLRDLAGFSHAWLLCHFHRSEGHSLEVVPPWDGIARGLFATRSPRRPNPIGLCLVAIEAIEGNALFVLLQDICDGTPLLDIKPYIPEGVSDEQLRLGWLEGKITRR